MASSDLRQYTPLIFGVFFLFLGVAATVTGESWSRFGRVISRAKNPKEFWRDVAVSYAGGVVLIAFFVYRVYWVTR
jgi:hypothetical protein